MTEPSDREPPPHVSPEPPAGLVPGPIRCTDGPLVCRVEVWDEAHWVATPPDRRPARAAHVPGLGWVVSLPEDCMN